MNTSFADQNASVNVKPTSSSALLVNARNALRKGNWRIAYQLSLEATRRTPENPDAWLIRSRTAASVEEKLFCLSQVNRLAPGHPGAQHDLYQILWIELERDPYLAYMDETDKLYYVRSNGFLSIAVPKGRGIPETYPPILPNGLSSAYRWLAWAALGLLLCGFGTLLFVPLAALSAWKALFSSRTESDRIRAGIVLFLSLFLLAPALFLITLFLVHLQG